MSYRIDASKAVAGLLFGVVGAVTFFWAQEYRTGIARQMGPGYFPSLLGIILFVLGVATIIAGVAARKPDPLPKIKLEPLLLILASVVSFGLLIDRAGMVIATLFCVVFACFRRLLAHPIEVILMFLALCTFNYIVFILALGMDIPLMRWNF